MTRLTALSPPAQATETVQMPLPGAYPRPASTAGHPWPLDPHPPLAWGWGEPGADDAGCLCAALGVRAAIAAGRGTHSGRSAISNGQIVAER
eukprot:1088449-Pelagomonas_calceolata.AAC.7